jgi:hypothetical protein
MSLWGALAGGSVGAMVLTTALRTRERAGYHSRRSAVLRVTRDRARAKPLGYLLHLVAGVVFALTYPAFSPPPT